MDFLNNLPLDQTAVTVAMVAVVVLFALVGVVKGILKTIFTLIQLGLAGAAFVGGFLVSPPYIKQYIPEAPDWLPLAAGGACALLVLFLIHAIIGILTGKGKKAKVEGPATDKKKRHNPLAPLFGLIAGVAVLYALLTGIRFGGSQAELQHLQRVVTVGEEQAGELPLLAKAKAWVESSPIASLQERFDPLYDRAKENLAKLVIISAKRELLAQLRTDEENEAALNQPEIKALALTGEQQRQLAQKGDFSQLYKDPRFLLIATKPSTRREVLKLDLSVAFPEEQPQE